MGIATTTERSVRGISWSFDKAIVLLLLLLLGLLVLVLVIVMMMMVVVMVVVMVAKAMPLNNMESSTSPYITND